MKYIAPIIEGEYFNPGDDVLDDLLDALDFTGQDWDNELEGAKK
jgi:hypothetical protein